MSSVFLEYARPLVPWVLDICYPSTCNAPSPDRRWTSSLTAFKSLLKSHVLSETLPDFPFYPVSASCLEFQFTIPCSSSLFSFPLFNTNQFENTLYLLIVSWLLSDTLKWKIHAAKIILFLLFITISQVPVPRRLPGREPIWSKYWWDEHKEINLKRNMVKVSKNGS